MKVNIEINFDEVNYDEIEQVEDLTLYDSMDGWINAEWPIDDEGDIDAIMKKYEVDEDEELHLEMEDELFNLLDEEEDGYPGNYKQDVMERLVTIAENIRRLFERGLIDIETHDEVFHALNYVVYDMPRPRLNDGIRYETKDPEL